MTFDEYWKSEYPPLYEVGKAVARAAWEAASLDADETRAENARLTAEFEAAAELIVELVEMAKTNEWQSHNAAENTYCPFCANESERWHDQIEHHEGCKFVDVLARAARLTAKE